MPFNSTSAREIIKIHFLLSGKLPSTPCPYPISSGNEHGRRKLPETQGSHNLLDLGICELSKLPEELRILDVIYIIIFKDEFQGKILPGMPSLKRVVGKTSWTWLIKGREPQHILMKIGLRLLWN